MEGGSEALEWKPRAVRPPRSGNANYFPETTAAAASSIRPCPDGICWCGRLKSPSAWYAAEAAMSPNQGSRAFTFSARFGIISPTNVFRDPFGRASSVFSECFFKRMRPKKKEKNVFRDTSTRQKQMFWSFHDFLKKSHDFS